MHPPFTFGVLNLVRFAGLILLACLAGVTAFALPANAPRKAAPTLQLNQSAPPASPAAPALPPATVEGTPSFTRAAETPEQKALMQKLIRAAEHRPTLQVTYDPTYFRLSYPMGDPPADKGVCTDEVVRCYRLLGIDLQKEVHEDMKENFALYPRKWGLRKPDTNIDHRRVPNLMVYFKRMGASLPVTDNPADYLPGDLVTWNLRSKGDLPHIGIVVTRVSDDGKRHCVVHNIGAGPQNEDMLMDYTITGHYRYYGKPSRIRNGDRGGKGP